MQNRLKIRLLRAALVLIFPVCAHATIHIHYVDAGGINPVAPYTNWLTAATNIQDAVDVAQPNESVLVTNGIYQFGGRVNSDDPAQVNNRVSVSRPIRMQSVNGPAVTIIQGARQTATNAAVRCVFLGAGGTMSGFTLTNGATTSLGVGGGVNMWSSFACTLSNCIIVNNAAEFGGGIYARSDAWFYNCKIIGNVAFGSSGSGGGACSFGTAWFINCIFGGNSAYAGGAAENCTLVNCTIIGNTGQADGIDGNVGGSRLFNCIAYNNSPDNGESSGDGVSFFNCCVAALPTTNAVNIITNAPLFVDLMNGDYHLQSNSPCINAGKNSYSWTGIDLDNNLRISGGTVDIGAYEFQNPSSVISYAWLQQYGLPTDGSADNLDSDGDGMNNYREWKTWTIPTNGASLLKMNSVIVTNLLSGATITWQSISNQTYFLQRSTDLSAQPIFTTIVTNIIGQTSTTSYTDEGATNPVSFFYRVGVL